LKVGPQTTVFTGPRRKDGTIDYVAAWNKRQSQGVTAKNNGFVDIANTMMGPPERDEVDRPLGTTSQSSPGPFAEAIKALSAAENQSAAKRRKKLYARLGVAPPGKSGPYFVGWLDFASQQGL